MSLRSKVFAAFFSFILIPLLLLGVIAYYFVSDMIEKKYSQQAELTLRALSQSVDFIFHEMDKVTDSAIASRAIQEVFSNRSYNAKDVTQIDYLSLNEIQQNFRELLVNHPSVSNAFLYTLLDDRINALFSRENFRAMPSEKFREHAIYQGVVNRQGAPTWVGPNEYPELTGTGSVFTQIRVVKDIVSLNDKGILFVQIKNSGLEGIFRYFSYNQNIYETRFFIVNDRGLILFDSSDEINGQHLKQYMDGPIQMDGKYHSSRQMYANQDSIVSSTGLDTENWHLVSVVSWSSLSKEITLYAKWVAAITILCLLSAIVFILFFVNRIVKSIINTVHFMRRVERGDLSTRIPIRGNDETSFLARGFNSLVHRIAELLYEVKLQQERKTRAEMIALQAQIKPHFLFNVLESINILAVQNQGKKVSQMVTRLGNMLRISIQQQEEITIEQEMNHLCSYLEIQKFRFEELFDFSIDIPQSLNGYLMLKLTLQPLVENSIQHGFEGIEYIGHIRIRACDEDDHIAFYIEDNGIGILPERLAVFDYRRDDETIHRDSPELGERRGLGVRNVAERIRIQYGNRFGLFICSEVGIGTTIKFVIPKYVGSV
jgi:two-component system sensor histidine kinase YesM